MPIIPAGISASTVAAVGAGVSAAGSVAGGLLSSGASGKAASEQQATSMASLAQQQAQFAYSQGLELPYVQNGDNAETIQNDWLGQYGTQVLPSFNALTALGSGPGQQAALEQTPGYQFTLNQGLKSTQNAAAARGLGVSGAALKGAANYATGLADNTFQQQYADASNTYDKALSSWNGLNNALSGMATLGGNVSVQAGTQAQAASNNTSNLLTGQGNSQAASTLASGNATQSSINGVSNALTGLANNPNFVNYLVGNGSMYAANSSANQIAAQNGTTGVGVSAGVGGSY